MTSQSHRSNCRGKIACLRRLLRGFGRVGIAFSGGVDSSFLLRAAIDTLGAENVLALHARSCLLKKEEQEQAASWLERHGIPAARLRLVELEPLMWVDFVRNQSDRCYICKRRIYLLFQTVLTAEGITVLLDGTNADDIQRGQEERPGLRAVAELAVQTPLATCNLSKAEIRELSRELGLDTWEQPANSCLATRISQGLEITIARLEQVAAMEQILMDFGFSGCRARLLQETVVCLQLRRQDMDDFCRSEIRNKLCSLFKEQGMKKMFLDLDGR